MGNNQLEIIINPQNAIILKVWSGHESVGYWELNPVKIFSIKIELAKRSYNSDYKFIFIILFF